MTDSLDITCTDKNIWKRVALMGSDSSVSLRGGGGGGRGGEGKGGLELVKIYSPSSAYVEIISRPKRIRGERAQLNFSCRFAASRRSI